MANNESEFYLSFEEAMGNAEDKVKYWQNQVKQAKKIRKDWVDDARQSIATYSTETQSSFNIHYSNVSTRLAAQYNSKPIVDVRPTELDTEQASRDAARLFERALSRSLDSYDFSEVIKAAILSKELAALGQVRVFYDAEMYTDYIEDEQGNTQPFEQVRTETAVARFVPHEHYLEGASILWEDVPWLGYMLFLNKDDIRKLTQIAKSENGRSMKIASGLEDKLTFGFSLSEKDDKKTGTQTENAKGLAGYEKVWQIWCKANRTVYLISENYTQEVLYEETDPAPRVPGFFPSPRPLVGAIVPGTRVPICAYNYYKRQAEVLSTITDRIESIAKICKYRGIRAGDVDELDDLNTLSDGEFKPSEKALQLLMSGNVRSMEDLLWTIPLEELSRVLRELIQIRAILKDTVYEVTGISDVLRGATDPRETATAQDIKTQFGSMRINEDQRDVQRFVVDILRLKAAIMSNHFSDETFFKIFGGIPDGTRNDDASSIKTAIDLIRRDVFMYYRIDIETDSTIRGDLEKAKANAAEFVSTMSGFAQTFVPMIEQYQLPATPFLKMMQGISVHFHLGKQVEMAFEDLLTIAMQMDQENQAGAAEKKAKAEELQQRQSEVAVATLEAELDKVVAEAEKLRAEVEKIRAEAANVGAIEPENPLEQMKQVNEIRKGEADVRKTEADIQKTEAETVKVAMEATEPEEKEDEDGPESDGSSSGSDG